MPFEQHPYVKRPRAVENHYYSVVAGGTRNMQRSAAVMRELIPGQS